MRNEANRNLRDNDPKGWIRIGRFDSAGRRSTWARFIFPDGPHEVLDGWSEYDAIAIEICSGREGDDAIARIEWNEPCFNDMRNVIGYSIYNVGV